MISIEKRYLLFVCATLIFIVALFFGMRRLEGIKERTNIISGATNTPPIVASEVETPADKNKKDYEQCSNISQQSATIETLIKNGEVKKDDVVGLILAKNGCTWNNPEMTDNAAFISCEIRVSDKLKKEQDEKFQKYIGLLNNWPKDNTHTINAPYLIESAIQTVMNWHNKINDYVESKCTAEIQTIGGTSGQDGIKAECEVSQYQDNINLLDDRIKSFQDHSANVENLIKTGAINKNTTY
jgi:hypothetical protein